MKILEKARDSFEHRMARLLVAGSCLGLVVPMPDARSQEVRDVRPQQAQTDAAMDDRKQMASLQSTMTALRSELTALQQSSLELARQLDELKRTNPSDPSSKTTNPAAAQDGFEPPADAAKDWIADWKRFREDVLKVVEPELAELRDEIAALEAQYAGHVHDYDQGPAHGWSTMATLKGCLECLLPFRTAASSPDPNYQETGTPKAD